MKLCVICCALAAALGGAGVVQAQTASQALDASWVTACADAIPGTNFHDRCQEILNAGPGSAARKSAAALGNNLEIFAAQGRLMMAMAKARGRAAAKVAARSSKASGNNFTFADATEAGSADLVASGGNWSFLGSVSLIDVDHADTGFERGYQDSGRSYLLGLDYRFNNRWTGLLALQRESRKVDFEQVSGGLDSTTDMLSAAVSFNGDKSFSASLALNAGRLQSTLRREIDYTLTLNAGQPNERRVTITSTGESENSARVRSADFNAGWDRGVGAWTLRYGGGLSWQRTEVDRIAENNEVGLDFLILKQEVKSLQAGLEFQLARAYSVNYGVWQPYVRLAWKHEFADDPRRVFAFFRGGKKVFRLSFLTGEPDRSFGEVGVGVIGLFPRGWQAYAGWQRTLGNELLVENRFDLGWRREF